MARLPGDRWSECAGRKLGQEGQGWSRFRENSSPATVLRLTGTLARRGRPKVALTSLRAYCEDAAVPGVASPPPVPATGPSRLRAAGGRELPSAMSVPTD